MFDKYKYLRDYIQRNAYGGYTFNGPRLDMFDFGHEVPQEYIPNDSSPYYILIEYQVKEKIDILGGMEMNVTKRKGLALDLNIPDNAKAKEIMKIVNEQIYLATELTEFTIITINDL